MPNPFHALTKNPTKTGAAAGSMLLGPGVGTGLGALAGWGLGRLFGGKQPGLRPGPSLPPGIETFGLGGGAFPAFGGGTIPAFGGKGNPLTAGIGPAPFLPSSLPGSIPSVGTPVNAAPGNLSIASRGGPSFNPTVAAPKPRPATGPRQAGGMPSYLANMNWSNIGARGIQAAPGGAFGMWSYGDLRNPFGGSISGPVTNMFGPVGGTL